MQKQRIELELAESRARIGSEILEKAQRNQEDSIHIDQALQRKVLLMVHSTSFFKKINTYSRGIMHRTIFNFYIMLNFELFLFFISSVIPISHYYN